MKINALVMMLMIILVATQVECITPSPKFPPIKLVQPFCDLKCDGICLNHKLGKDFDDCVRYCRKHKC